MFTRIFLLSVVMVLAVRLGGLLLGAAQSPEYDEGATQDVVAALDSASDQLEDEFVQPSSARALPISIVPVAMKLDVAVRPKLVDLRAHVFDEPAVDMAGSAEFQRSPSVDRVDDDLFETFTSPAFPLDSRVAFAACSMLLALFALLGIWRMQRPLRNVTQAARASACGCGFAMVPEEGPGELRQLVRSFNETIRRRQTAVEHQSAAIAALTRCMEFRTASLRARALAVAEWHKRVAFVEDIDSFSTIAQQLLDVAGRDKTGERPIAVDAFLHDRYAMTSVMDMTCIALDLRAGPQFTWPRTLLERLMANLVGNALAHGAPPVEISTARDQRGWVISVRDHGAGIPQNALAAAATRHVRLGAARRIDQHWGLGLAIVASLARDGGAQLELENHPGGGLQVQVILPEQ